MRTLADDGGTRTSSGFSHDLLLHDSDAEHHAGRWNHPDGATSTETTPPDRAERRGYAGPSVARMDGRYSSP